MAALNQSKQSDIEFHFCTTSWPNSVKFYTLAKQSISWKSVALISLPEDIQYIKMQRDPVTPCVVFPELINLLTVCQHYRFHCSM